MGYRVIVPCVVAPLPEVGNREFYFGAFLTPGVPADRIKMWLADGLIEQADPEAEQAPAAPPTPVKRPVGAGGVRV